MGVLTTAQRMHAAVQDSALDDVCDRAHVRVLALFGSTARHPERAHDLDLAVLLGPAARCRCRSCSKR